MARGIFAGAEVRGTRVRQAGRPHVFALFFAGIMVFSAGLFGGCAGFVNGTKTALQAAFQLGASSLNFGSVPVGKQSTQTVSISNTGNTGVSITQVTFSNPQFSLPSATFPMSLATGQTSSLTVAITPTAKGTVTGTMTVEGSGGSSPASMNLSASAASAGPQISLSNTTVPFGTVSVGSTANASVTVSNIGSSDLTISVIGVSGDEFGESGITTPKTISAGQSAPMALTFHPTSAGAVTGSVTITSNDPVNPTTTIGLTGTGSTSAVGQLQANPTSLSFGSVSTGSNSSQPITLTNTGSSTVQISGVSVTGAGFSAGGIAFPYTLTPSAAVTLNATFAPTAAGAATGSITVNSNAGGPALVIPVSGTGAQMGLTVTPQIYSFGNVADGQTKSQTFTITNTGTASLTISQLSVSGAGYSVTGLNTPATLAAGASTTFSAVFAPTALGSMTATVAISSNVPNSPATISLSGTGVQLSLSVTPQTYNFGSVVDGQTKSQNFTITNTGTAFLIISQLSVSGTGFSVSGLNTPVTLAAGTSTTFTAGFAPTALGSMTGTVSIASNDPNSPTTISLSGTGVQAGLSVTPQTYSFGSVVDGQTNSQTFTITNTGTAPLVISQLAVGGADYSVSGLNTPATLAVGASATFSAVFAPTVAGSLTGTVTISSNAPNPRTTISLSGTGVASTIAISANPTSLGFGSVNAGSSSTKSVVLTNTGNSNVTISQITVSGKDVTETGITLPVTMTPGETETMNINFSPTAEETVTGNITVANSQGGSTVVSVSGTGLQAGISLTPSGASFGNVPVGTTTSQTIQISNPGNGALTITQASVTGAGFSTGGLSLPLSLNPGQTGTFNVQFDPSSAGSVNGSISIVSNALGSPSVITMSGTGIAATETLSFSTTSVSFGSVNTGSSSTQSETITNTGNSNVQISQIVVSGTGYSLSGASTPVTLSPSQTLTFNIVFSPTAAGSDPGSVTVTSNATGSPAIITLSGTGVAASSHTVALSWTASTSTVSGYNVYRSTTNGAGYTKLNTSLVSSVTYTDAAILSGTTYYYVTTAVDSSGDESAYSNQASAVIP